MAGLTKQFLWFSVTASASVSGAQTTQLVKYVLLDNSVEPVLTAPQNVQATAGDGEATITWDAVVNADFYNLYYSIFPLTSNTNIEKLINLQSGYTLTGLTNDTTYYLALTSENTNSGESNLSEGVSVTPMGNLDPEPTTDWVKLLGEESSKGNSIITDANNIGSFEFQVGKLQFIIQQYLRQTNRVSF